jgi:LCP family protein required for cell wall assembly
LKVTIITALVLANIAVLGFIWIVQTGNALFGRAQTDDEVTGALDPSSGDALTFVIVGSDTREGLETLDNFGTVGGARGDVVMLVRVDSNTSTAQMLSIPRDLYVDIEGHGQNRINAAYTFGGPSLLVETLKRELDVEINHYVEVDFVGFQALVDEVGGISIDFPYAARDSKSGLDIEAGSQTLNGAEALAYARARHYQEYQDGEWVSIEANDIGRTQRQQEVVRAILSQLKNPSSIAEAGSLASTMGQHMTIDSTLAATSVASLVWDFKGVLTGSVVGATLPTEGRTIDGRSVVVADEPEASAMLANFRAGVPLAGPAVSEVLSSSSAEGAAGDVHTLGTSVSGGVDQ